MDVPELSCFHHEWGLHPSYATDNGGKTGGKVGGDVVENIVGNIVENIIDVPSLSLACPELCHKLCHCPHRPSGHGRHAELRNIVSVHHPPVHPSNKTKKIIRGKGQGAGGKRIVLKKRGQSFRKLSKKIAVEIKKKEVVSLLTRPLLIVFCYVFTYASYLTSSKSASWMLSSCFGCSC